MLGSCITATTTAVLLSSFVVQTTPWRSPEANSEQRQPVYLGATPLELELGAAVAGRMEVPRALQTLAEKQAHVILKDLKLGHADFELWPVRDDDGRLTWQFARWRPDPACAWHWLEATREEEAWEIDPVPLFSRAYHMNVPEDKRSVFEDSLKQGLYDKPAFGECVWAGRRTDQILEAWLPTSLREVSLASLGKNGMICHALSQPARWNGKPVSLVLHLDRSKDIAPEWKSEVVWVDEKKCADRTEGLSQLEFSNNFALRYEEDVRIFSGEAEAVFPVSKTRQFFKRKNSATQDHELELLVDYLEERYAELGIKTVRQKFSWRGIAQSNLVAIIPGTLPSGANFPVVMADHIDAAFQEDEFERSGNRVSAPGADDNATAMSALLRAAEALQDIRPKNDIWLVHLTGEEFPADDLGARIFVGDLLKKKKKLKAIVLLDMVGYDPNDERIVQINAGESCESQRVATQAVRSVRSAAPMLKPVLRQRFDDRSYLYNTDGLIFSDAGYPVILFNEHINRLENLDRPHYHQSTDTAATLNFPYAVAITQSAIETVASLAQIAH